MGLLDRISDMSGAKFEADMQAADDKKSAELQKEMARLKIVAGKLAEAAARINEPLADLQAMLGKPGYWQLGDVILLVEPFPSLLGKAPEPTDRQMALSYCVYLIAVYEGRKVRVKVGALQLLTLESIASAVTNSIAGYDFRASSVLRLLVATA